METSGGARGTRSAGIRGTSERFHFSDRNCLFGLVSWEVVAKMRDLRDLVTAFLHFSDRNSIFSCWWNEACG